MDRWLVCSDIFGYTNELDELVSEVFLNNNTVVLSPYSTIHKTFATENEAYEAFNAEGGISAYVERITELLLRDKGFCGILGFSAGGAAAWKANALVNDSAIHQLVCFYPGQIRHFLDISPNVPTQLIFPSHEPHFDLGEVISSLQHKGNVSIERSPYKHGFMNAKSSGFHQGAYRHYVQMLKTMIA